MRRVIDLKDKKIYHFTEKDLTDSEDYEEDELVKLAFGRDVLFTVKAGSSRNDIPIHGYVYRENKECKCMKLVAPVAVYVGDFNNNN